MSVKINALSRAEIMAARSEVKCETIEVERLGFVRIRELNYGSAKSLRAHLNTEKFDLMYFIACVVDDEGAPMFTADDYSELAALPVSIVNTVVAAAIKLANGSTEELRKN